MKREQKIEAVEELTSSMGEAGSIFAVDYRGISVGQAAELRARLREADAVFKVVKNRLAKRAIADAGVEAIDEHLVGPTALTLIQGDAVIAAKAISTFARENDVLEFKGGLMDGEVLDPDGFAAIARLPELDVLRGQLVGIAASPITGLARGLGSMLSGIAIALGQIAEQGLVSGEPPEADEHSEAQGAEEAPGAEDEAEPEAGASDEVAEREAEPAAPAASQPADTGAEGEDVGGGAPGGEAEDVGGGTDDENKDAEAKASEEE